MIKICIIKIKININIYYIDFFYFNKYLFNIINIIFLDN